MDWKWKQIYKYIKIYKKKKVYGLLNTWLGGWWDYYTGPKIGALSRVSQGHVGYALVMKDAHWPIAICISHQSQWIKACTKCGSYAILALGGQIPLYYHHTAVRLLFFIFIFYFLINEWQDDKRAGYAITIPIPFHFHLHWIISSPP